MSDIELKPCPFCGGKAKCIEYYGLFHVICCDCYIAGRDRPSIDGAIEAWNTRPIEDALKAENARFREALEFYAKEIIYQVYSDGIPTEVEQDGGSFARQVLKGELNE